jgi:hypothetical protein
MQDMIRRSSGLVSFLPRRTLENYLLHPKAISSVLREADCAAGGTVREEDVRNWISRHGDRYGGTSDATGIDDPKWHADVDAPSILLDMFNDLSEARVEYRKVKHSVAILRWILGNEPGFVDELSKYVVGLLPEELRQPQHRSDVRVAG